MKTMPRLKGFKQTHVIADQHHRAAGDRAEIVDPPQMDPAAAPLDQMEILVGERDLTAAVESTALPGRAAAAEDQKILQIKVPAAAAHQPEHLGNRQIIRSVVTIDLTEHVLGSSFHIKQIRLRYGTKKQQLYINVA